MKKVLMGLILMITTVTLVACSNTDKETKSNKESHPTKVVEKSTPTNKKSKNKETKTLWTNDKSKQLTAFMSEFGSKMQQSYSEFKPGHDTSYAGLHYPSDFQKNNITIDGVRKSVSWSNDGTGSADVNVVGIYVNNDEATMGGHIYLFAIVDKQPVVYHTNQNQDTGDHLTHFTTTENTKLKDGFKAIVVGEKVKTTEESSKAKSTQSRSNGKTHTQLQKENNNMPISSDIVKDADGAINYLNSQKGNHNWTVSHGSAGISSPIHWTLQGDNGETWLVYADGAIKPM